jgi:hypothetical protein
MPRDAVLITVTIDPSVIKVSLGSTDDNDAFIERQLLGMWYREGTDKVSTKISATHSLSDKSLTTALQDFSEYAVSW